MRIEHLNVIGGSSVAIKLISVWDAYVEILERTPDHQEDVIALHELAGTDRRATAKWTQRLLNLGVVSYDNGVEPRALAIVQRIAAEQYGLKPKKKQETEGESPDETTRKEVGNG